MGYSSYKSPFPLSGMGIFIVTYTAQFDLHAMRPHFPQPIYQIDQFQQAASM
jgi:hypothetical protein